MHLRPLLLPVLAGLLLAGPASASCPAWLLKWGAFGAGNGQFNFPQGPSLSPSGEVYVADFSNQRIQKFAANGAHLLSWGSFGSGNGQFNYPFATAVGPSGNVYVVDINHHRIQRFSPTGVFQLKWGTNGSADGQFRSPYDVATDPNTGDVYVADYGNSRVQKFDANGTFLLKWTAFVLSGVTVDNNGHVYVTDLNHRVRKFDANGNFLLTWGGLGSGNGQFSNPVQPSFDGMGGVYVTDSNNHRVQLFTTAGVFVCALGSLGTGNGQFERPFGCEASSTANGVTLVVADRFNNRIQRFGDLATPAPLTTWGRLKSMYRQ